jgi:hypothetical protein
MKIIKTLVTSIAIILAILFAKEYVYEPKIWPIISKQIGPTDNQIKKVIYHYVEKKQIRELTRDSIVYEADDKQRSLLFKTVVLQKLVPDCTTNELIQFLFKSKVISLGSDCRVSSIASGHWNVVDHGNYYEIKPMSSDYTRLETTIKPSGADYILTFKLPIRNSPFSAALGIGIDSIVAYEGQMTLRFAGSDLLSNWLPQTESILVRAVR